MKTDLFSGEAPQVVDRYGKAERVVLVKGDTFATLQNLPNGNPFRVN